jgi:DDE superfamily endonuclease
MADPGLAPDQKKARRREAEIVFMDETGFSFRANSATTWAPIGQTPILRRISKRRALSTAIGLTLSGRIYKRHFAQAICGDNIVTTLRHLQRYMPGPLIVIWDRLSAHRALIVKEYLAEHPEIHVEWLPAYAPDLNPEEGCHGTVPQHLRNATPASIHELRAQVDRGFARLRQRPDLILGFFRHAGLSVTQLW